MEINKKIEVIDKLPNILDVNNDVFDVCCKCLVCGEVFIRRSNCLMYDHDCPEYINIDGDDFKRCNSCTEYKNVKCFDDDKCDCCYEFDTCNVENKVYGYNSPIRIEYKLIDANAIRPRIAKSNDAAFDLYSVQDKVLTGNSTSAVRTGVVFTAPNGYYFTIEGRSSLFNHGIVPARGIIDATYTGEMIVALTNTTNKEYNICAGDRIAQAILHRTVNCDLVLVDKFSLNYRNRGNSGFGSTGK